MVPGKLIVLRKKWTDPTSHRTQESIPDRELNIKGKTIEIQKDNIKNNFKILGAEKIDKFDFIKIQNVFFLHFIYLFIFEFLNFILFIFFIQQVLISYPFYTY